MREEQKPHVGKTDTVLLRIPGVESVHLFTLKSPVNVRMAEIRIILQLGLLTFLIIPCDYSNCLQATYKSHKSWNSSLNLEISIVWQWDVYKCLHHEL